MRDQPDSSSLSCLCERDDGRLPELLPSEPHGLHRLGIIGKLVAVVLKMRQREAGERSHVLMKRAGANEGQLFVHERVWGDGRGPTRSLNRLSTVKGAGFLTNDLNVLAV